MTAQCFPLPDALFDDERFKALPYGPQMLLVRLYREFGDCKTFSVHAKSPEGLRDKQERDIHSKLRPLVSAGLVVVDRPAVNGRGKDRPRVFRFKYSVEDAHSGERA